MSLIYLLIESSPAAPPGGGENPNVPGQGEVPKGPDGKPEKGPDGKVETPTGPDGKPEGQKGPDGTPVPPDAGKIMIPLRKKTVSMNE